MVSENCTSLKIVIIDLIHFFSLYEEHELIVCPSADIAIVLKNYFNLSDLEPGLINYGTSISKNNL